MSVDNLLSQFLCELEEIPWFSNIGHPIRESSNIKRIYYWEEWPGPEEPEIGELAERQQKLYDVLMMDTDSKSVTRKLWETVHEIVFRHAAVCVPYDANEDTWHGPTAAVWQAAWTAGLVALCLQQSLSVPDELKEQWQWFVRGHWPCGFTQMLDEDESGALLVY